MGQTVLFVVVVTKFHEKSQIRDTYHISLLILLLTFIPFHLHLYFLEITRLNKGFITKEVKNVFSSCHFPKRLNALVF